MSVHTPGNWISFTDRNGRFIVGSGTNCDVAYVAHPPVGNSDANARLIAAAPDLLEALQMALAELDGLNLDAIGFDRTTLETMREAIAKAVAA